MIEGYIFIIVIDLFIKLKFRNLRENVKFLYILKIGEGEIILAKEKRKKEKV